MSAYARDNGSLVAIDLMCLDDEPGRVNIGHNYNPVALTLVGTTELKGWGADDGTADVYETEAGREIIVSQRMAGQVRNQLSQAKVMTQLRS